MGMQIVDSGHGQEPNKEYICHQWEIRVDVMNGGERRVTSVLAGTRETCKRCLMMFEMESKVLSKDVYYLHNKLLGGFWESVSTLTFKPVTSRELFRHCSLHSEYCQSSLTCLVGGDRGSAHPAAGCWQLGRDWRDFYNNSPFTPNTKTVTTGI